MITAKDDTTFINGWSAVRNTFYGLSGDEKPLKSGNGSLFIEIDTGKKYLFSAGDSEWYEQPESSGGSLPEVTADDNGDVLTVVEGAWAKAAPSGGGGVLVVNWNTATGALDKTWQEIYDADFAVIHMDEDEDELDRVYAFVQEVIYDDPNYGVTCFATGGGTVNNFDFIAESADGYPAMQGGN